MALKKLHSLSRLEPGDQLQIEIKQRFSLGESMDAYFVGLQISKYEENPRIEVLSWEMIDGGVLINAKVTESAELMQAGVITAGSIIAIAIGLSLVAVSATVYKVVDSVEDNIDSPVTTAFVSSGLLLAIAAVIGAVYLFKK